MATTATASTASMQEDPLGIDSGTGGTPTSVLPIVDLDGLPRSVRWRIQLGLLELDPSFDVSALGSSQLSPSASPSSSVLEDLYHFNIDLISDQKVRFQELMEKYVEEQEQYKQEQLHEQQHEQQQEQQQEQPTEESLEEATNDHTRTNDSVDDDNSNKIQSTSEMDAAEGVVEIDHQEDQDIDPLTAMVMEEEARQTRKQELYLKYRKERARFKRGLTAEAGNKPYVGDSNETSAIDRASMSIIEKDLNRLPHPMEASATNDNSNTVIKNEESRISTLREILYIYAQEDPTMGYRQGMHEIASHILYVLELEEPQYKDNPLFTPIMPICFCLLEKILEQLRTAYDASGENSLDHMSQAILRKLYQNDRSLYQHLTTSPNIPPPPIYCTRWVRLMFSREVVGYENVFKLWDVFLDAAYKNNSMSSLSTPHDEASSGATNAPPANNGKLMHVLEVTAASRILLLRNALLNSENNSLDLLMNIPSLVDISPLTTTLHQLMEQGELEKSVVLPTMSMGMQPSQQQSFYPSAQPQHGLNNNKASFSLKSFGQTLGQKSESIRKKLISTTNEWKQRDLAGSGASIASTSAAIVSRATPAHFVNSTNAIAAAATQAIRNHVVLNTPTETVLFDDPLQQSIPTTPHLFGRERESKWAHVLQQKIWALQEYLMSLEQQPQPDSLPSTPTNASSSGGTQGTRVPREIWEALAELDRVQNEIQNFAMEM